MNTAIKNLLSYSWIKDNLNMIILIPTVAGGIWQILELSSIGTPYIRFFSISQLISDGLLLTFVFFWIFIIIRLCYIATFGETKSSADQLDVNLQESEKKINKLFEWFWVFILVIGGVFFVKILIKNILSLVVQEAVTLVDIIGIEISVLMFIVIISVIIGSVIRITKHKFKLNIDLMLDWVKFPMIIISLTVLYGIFRFIPVFHNSFIKSKDFNNMNNLTCHLLQENKNIKSYELLYFNDKYIFLKIRTKSNKEFTEVKKFELFLEQCSSD